ncbi:PLAC8-domain-containing protein [Exidia glandulosa HHB12029]|uniref:PLAC8-domain-containing protein n=1 Tax=Exidia glandulosa HHB12029 TaxID=1314781 RepID=A0A165FWH4_EXIGL|nr:PLAC8-domain-containing protein [Exidia glandulosa HHB12029]
MQMQATPGMNRNPKNLPYNSDGKREWSEGLCDCCGSCGVCCVATFFPCITYAKNKSRREYLGAHNKPHPSGGDCCGCDCFLYACLTSFTCLGWCLSISERTATRSRYSIKGNWCSSCMAVWCCLPCAMTQESREIELEERSLQRY